VLIVLDTTETYTDLRLDSPDFRLLNTYVVRHPVKLFIPEIVVRETINHFRETFVRSVSALKDAVGAIARLAPHTEVNLFPDIDIDKELASYELHLSHRLSGLRAKRESHANVTVDQLVDRALQRRKPFDSAGERGFRDALLWETVLQIVLAHQEPLVLVTRNKKDFGEHDSLAQDLQHDLVAVGLDHRQVTICAGLSQFVTEIVKPGLERLEEIRELINCGEFEPFQADNFFEEHSHMINHELAQRMRTFDLEGVTWEFANHYHSPMLGSTGETAERFEVVDVWRVDEEEISIEICYSVPGSVTCMREVLADYPEDGYWNTEHEGDVDFQLSINVVVNTEDRDVVSWEIDGIALTPGSHWE